MASKSTTRPLPGRQQLSREFIARHQRVRIITALAQEISEQGYRQVTVADIVRRAGIARNTFYENFRSKEDCFLATQEFAMSAALERVVDAAGELESWPRGSAPGSPPSSITSSRSRPSPAPAWSRRSRPGRRPCEHYEESQQAFVSLFKLGRDVSPHGAELPETLEEAIIGGVFWIVYQRLAVGETAAIGELLPELIEFALTPYLGAERLGRSRPRRETPTRQPELSDD